MNFLRWDAPPGSGAQIPRAALLLAAIALLTGAAAGGTQAERATTHDAAVQLLPQLDPSIPTSGNGGVRVAIWADRQDALTGSATGPDAALIRGENRAWGAGGVNARAGAARFAQLELARNRAIGRLSRRFGPIVEAQHDLIEREIQALGGRVEDAHVMPSVLVATVPRRNVAKLAKLPGIAAVEWAPRGRPLGASVIDGSPTWHASGCTGGGALDTECPAIAGAPGHVDSPDRKGGPDAAVADAGIRTTHLAFADRTPPVVSADGRSDKSGSKHANTIAAILAVKDNSVAGRRGMAYGLDKLIDPHQAKHYGAWLSGITYAGEAGVPDLPEVINISAGGDNGNDDNYGAQENDFFVSQYGIARSNAAGNDGPLNPFGTPQTQERVISPCIAYNGLCMGAMSPNSSGRSDDTVAGYSSRGPTFGGRKKPDLLSDGIDGCPSYQDDTTWFGGGSCGTGTSYAAPRAAAGIILLASVGITNTSAQRAILINTSYMLDSETDGDSDPQQYWTPDAGWGELALEQTFPKRGNYALGTVTGGPGINSARFFRADGMTAGDRTTLAWIRRVIIPYWPLPNRIAGLTVTDLDLFQLTTAGADNDADVCGAGVTTCGVDAAESSENTGVHAVATDNSDNVEQVRAAASGDSIFKVKATSNVVGAAGESFALASDRPLTALETPTVDVNTPLLTDTTVATGQDVTVTASFTNESTGTDLVTGLNLDSTTATLNLPAGIVLAPGSNPQSQPVGTLNTGETDQASWTVLGNATAVGNLTVSVQGGRFGESFGGTSANANITVDADSPSTTVSSPQSWHGSRSATVGWSASDAISGLASVEVQASIAGGPYETVYTGANATGNVAVAANENQQVVARVRATDQVGNVSSFQQSSIWIIDADPPTLSVSAPAGVTYGDPATFTVAATNVGSPVTVFSASNPQLSGRTPVVGGAVTATTANTGGVGSTLWFVAIDALGRQVVKSATVATTPRSTALRILRVRTKGRLVSVTATYAAGVSGLLVVTVTCGRNRARNSREAVGDGTTIRVRVRKRGRCAVMLRLSPRITYEYAAGVTTQRFRVG